MAKIFITGSADGLGQMAAELLIAQGHEVVLHARNDERGRDAINKTSGAAAVLTGDLSSAAETKNLADDVNRIGTFDAIIHNAGVYQTTSEKTFSVNTVAPFILTCLITKPKRLIYLTSGMHLQGRPQLEHLPHGIHHINYADSKLHVTMLAKAVARKWPEVLSNAVDPGWVPTKMGGRSAPDNLQKGYETQCWLATSNDPKAVVTGKYFYHQKEQRCNSFADDVLLQDNLLVALKSITGISFE